MINGLLGGLMSFSHVNLIVAAEGKIDIHFALKELPAIKNVGDLLSCIERKLAEN